ncbi:MAG: Crp/Fnr family transcriptional regulator [Clostridiales Family XIII bacterium]|jgi:CRP-like cAMP-binding protein|nr:Crp/Fnr family transcriptional regulator [Clostridiales Family XIII bacterium]
MYPSILKNSGLFDELPSRDFMQLCSCVKRRTEDFEKKQVLVYQGDSVSEIGILTKGSLVGEKYHMDGRVQIIRIFSPYSVVNLDAASSSAKTCPISITATDSGRIIWIPFDEMFKGDDLSADVRKTLFDNIMSILADDNIRMMHKSDILAVRTLRERIMAYFSIVSEKRGDMTVRLSMNQEELARYLCVDRSSLSSELNKMRKEGVLDFSKKTYTLMFNEN